MRAATLAIAGFVLVAPGAQAQLPAVAPPSGPAMPAAVSTARHHPMQYYLSLPTDWRANHSWPILLLLEGSGRDFVNEHKEFLEARGRRGFILVTPFIVSDRGRYELSHPYSDSVWTAIQRDGRLAFDLAGIDSVLADVRRDYNGQQRVYVAAFSAGGHLGWILALTRPDLVAAAELSAPTFSDEGLETAPEIPDSVTRPPILVLQGDHDPHVAIFTEIWGRAENAARARGYTDVQRRLVFGGHDRFAFKAMAWLDSLRAESRRVH